MATLIYHGLLYVLAVLYLYPPAVHGTHNCMEGRCLYAQGARFTLYWTENSTGVMLVLVCSSTVALLYNLVHSLMIHKTSAVTTTVLGEVKIIGLLVLSALLLGKVYQVLSFKLPVSCVCLYCANKILVFYVGP